MDFDDIDIYIPDDDEEGIEEGDFEDGQESPLLQADSDGWALRFQQEEIH